MRQGGSPGRPQATGPIIRVSLAVNRDMGCCSRAARLEQPHRNIPWLTPRRRRPCCRRTTCALHPATTGTKGLAAGWPAQDVAVGVRTGVQRAASSRDLVEIPREISLKKSVIQIPPRLVSGLGECRRGEWRHRVQLSGPRWHSPPTAATRATLMAISRGRPGLPGQRREVRAHGCSRAPSAPSAPRCRRSGGRHGCGQ